MWKKTAIACLVAMSLVGCQQIAMADRSELGRQAHGSLPKSPVGSIFQNQYVNDGGQIVTDTYQVQADHSVKLINRQAGTRD
jgi:hypothetical protein